MLLEFGKQLILIIITGRLLQCCEKRLSKTSISSENRAFQDCDAKGVLQFFDVLMFSHWQLMEIYVFLSGPTFTVKRYFSYRFSKYPFMSAHEYFWKHLYYLVLDFFNNFITFYRFIAQIENYEQIKRCSSKKLNIFK